jgi:succinate-semialdehyde dehydrogenase/glutarate-semialdehyde dehydrogenase
MTVVDELLAGPKTQLHIGGEWLEGSDQLDVVDPATEEVLATVGLADRDQALAAVDAASEAAPRWAATAPRERAEILRRSYELMREREEQLAELVVLENGKAYSDALGEVRYAAEFFRWFGEEAVRVGGENRLAPSGDKRILTFSQPVGVSLLITPWNFPSAMATRKIGPALAAGCTTILKPASDTPLSALAVADIMVEAGLAPGVVNVIAVRGSSGVLDAVLDDPRVRKLSFTGSTEVGKHLLGLAAKRVLRTSMELGGNAPFIVFEDADIEAAIEGAMVAKMRNAGEACTAANRFFIHGAIADAFTERLTEAMGALQVGPGIDRTTQVGPMINRSAVESIDELVSDAVDRDATVRLGGSAPDRGGYFYSPTVLDGVSPDADILHHEIFGPVAPIVRFADSDDVIAMANNTDLGLISYVYTGDLARGLRVSEALEAGMVGVNRGLVSDPAAPFGGVKESGIGREGSHQGMDEYLETKYVGVSW